MVLEVSSDGSVHRCERETWRARFGFKQALCVSLLLHALAGLWSVNAWVSPPSKPQSLMFDLVGMVSKRQIEEQRAGRSENSASQPVPPVAPTVAAPSRRDEQEKRPSKHAIARPRPTDEKGVKARPEEESSSASAARLAAMPSAAPSAGMEDHAAESPAQKQESDGDAIRRYLVGLKKAIQNKLVYPPDVRELGAVGSPLVRFTITGDGEILPGSLRLERSSGYAILDDNAMRAALAGAPFERPPHQMDVVIAVAFVRDNPAP